MIDILIPTYGRSDRIPGIVDNVLSTTTAEFILHFCVEADDTASIEAVAACGLTPIINRRARTYCGAINTGYESTQGDYLFAGADDLWFHQCWDTAALHRADEWVEVVGTNDCYNPFVKQGFHATHYLVARSYLDRMGGVVDEGPRTFLYEGYTHNYCDTEFIATAKMRSRFLPAMDSVVEHRHWTAGHGTVDANVERANATQPADRETYYRRQPLWLNLSL